MFSINDLKKTKKNIEIIWENLSKHNRFVVKESEE